MTKRAVLVGCGAMAPAWVKSLSEPLIAGQVELIALVDKDEAQARRLQQQFGLDRAEVSSDLGSVLSRTKADMIFDVAVPVARRQIVETALAAGCHVLTEKPMADTLENARALVLAAKKANRLHAVTQNRRFKHGIRTVQATVASGVLGEISALHCDFFIGAHFGGFRDVMDNVLLLDMAIHTFDAARFISGQEAQSVYCHETNPKGSWYAHGAAANAIFEMSDDVVFTYRGSWCAEGADTNWDSSWRIIGTKGTLLWDGESAFTVKVVAGNEGFFRPLAPMPYVPPPDIGQCQSHASVIADFLNAIETGAEPQTAGSDNIKSLAMVFAAIESAKTGQKITLDQQV